MEDSDSDLTPPTKIAARESRDVKAVPGDLIRLVGRKDTGAESLEMMGLFLRAVDIMNEDTNTFDTKFVVLSDSGDVGEGSDVFFTIQVIQPSPTGPDPKERTLRSLVSFVKERNAAPESWFEDWEVEALYALRDQGLAECEIRILDAVGYLAGDRSCSFSVWTPTQLGYQADERAKLRRLGVA